MDEAADGSKCFKGSHKYNRTVLVSITSHCVTFVQQPRANTGRYPCSTFTKGLTMLYSSRFLGDITRINALLFTVLLRQCRRSQSFRWPSTPHPTSDWDPRQYIHWPSPFPLPNGWQKPNTYDPPQCGRIMPYTDDSVRLHPVHNWRVCIFHFQKKVLTQFPKTSPHLDYTLDVYGFLYLSSRRILRCWPEGNKYKWRC